MPVEEKLLHWKEAERKAVEAETQLRNLGDASTDMAAARLALRARTLRREADGLFGALMREITGEGRPTGGN